MPETFSPIIWRNDQSPALNEVNLNRLEVGVEVLDDRIASLENGVVTPVVVPYATSITINATQGTFFRCLAAGDITVDGIVGGLDGQLVTLEIWATGGSRALSFTDLPATLLIPAGSAWTGNFRYRADLDSWVLQVTSGTTTGSSGGGSTATSPTLVLAPYASSLVLDALAGDIFRVTATGNLTLVNITNGTDGQLICLDIQASGADRTVTIGGAAETVPIGSWWSGELRYMQPADAWKLTNSAILAATVGLGISALGVSPLGSIPAGAGLGRSPLGTAPLGS